MKFLYIALAIIFGMAGVVNIDAATTTAAGKATTAASGKATTAASGKATTAASGKATTAASGKATTAATGKATTTAASKTTTAAAAKTLTVPTVAGLTCTARGCTVNASTSGKNVASIDGGLTTYFQQVNAKLPTVPTYYNGGL